MAKMRLKSSREAEARKLDLAVKYAERGVATGGGRIGTKKLRRTLEARYVPMAQQIPAGPPASRKTKHGRHHPPPPRETG